MNKAHRISAALLLMMLGCSDTADTSPDQEPATQRESKPSAARVATCGTNDGSLLTPDGIGQLRVGASMRDIRAECVIVRDTTAPDLEGMQQRRIAVDLERDTVEAVVLHDRVFRIHVAGPAYRTADGLGVGTTVAELRKDRAARVLAGEGSMFITVADQCGLSFRLGGVQFGPELPAADLPAEARVVEVLAFGCESPQP